MDISEQERRETTEATREWLSDFGDVLSDVELSPSIQWRPHLLCPSAGIAVHLLMYPDIRGHYLAAFEEARFNGPPDLRIIAAGPVQFVHQPDVLVKGHEAQIEWVVLESHDTEERSLSHYEDTLLLIYREELILPKDTFESIAALAYARMSAVTGAEKGRILERLLGYLFSQVPGLKVIDTNYYTATEEIDLVIQNHRLGGIFETYAKPLFLVESRNRKGRAGKNEYADLARKIGNRRNLVDLGYYVSLGGFAETFRLEALRDSRESFVIGQLDRRDIESWLHTSGEGAANLLQESLVRAAMD